MNHLESFFGHCLRALPDTRWDEDITHLHNSFVHIQHSIGNNSSNLLTAVSSVLFQYKDFVIEIGREAKSVIFSKLWNDLLSHQMKKYGRNAIQVKDMDRVDVWLFLESLKHERKSQDSQLNDAATIDDNDDELIFNNGISGQSLLKCKNSLKIGALLKDVNENTKSKWNGRVSMKLLSLMYKYIAKPKWIEFKQGIKNGFVPMKDVDYYFRECSVTSREKIRDELNRYEMGQGGVTLAAESIVNALKCQEMLDDELLIVNFLKLVGDIIHLCDDDSSNSNSNGVTKYLEVDAKFIHLLRQIDASKYPWNKDKMAQSGRETLNELISTPCDRHRHGRAATLKDILVIWEAKEITFFENVAHIKTERKDSDKKNKKNTKSKKRRYVSRHGRRHDMNSEDRVLNEASAEWLKLCLEYRDTIAGLFERFGDDEKFQRYKKLREYVETMSEIHRGTLEDVRNYFVKKIVEEIVSRLMNMSGARLFLVNQLFQEMTPRHVEQLRQFIGIWDDIENKSYLYESQYTQDRKLLLKVNCFVLQHCQLHVTVKNSVSVCSMIHSLCFFICLSFCARIILLTTHK